MFRFFADENGATAIEYGLIAALIAVAIITGLNQLAGALNDNFNDIANALDSSAGGGSGAGGGAGSGGIGGGGSGTGDGGSFGP